MGVEIQQTATALDTSQRSSLAASIAAANAYNSSGEDKISLLFDDTVRLTSSVKHKAELAVFNVARIQTAKETDALQATGDAMHRIRFILGQLSQLSSQAAETSSSSHLRDIQYEVNSLSQAIASIVAQVRADSSGAQINFTDALKQSSSISDSVIKEKLQATSSSMTFGELGVQVELSEAADLPENWELSIARQTALFTRRNEKGLYETSLHLGQDTIDALSGLSYDINGMPDKESLQSSIHAVDTVGRDLRNLLYSLIEPSADNDRQTLLSDISELDKITEQVHQSLQKNPALASMVQANIAPEAVLQLLR